MRKADNLPPYRAVVMKSGSLNFLDPSGPAQACYGKVVFINNFQVVLFVGYSDRMVVIDSNVKQSLYRLITGTEGCRRLKPSDF